MLFPLMCQQYKRLNNNERPLPDDNGIDHTNLEIFSYPFTEKEVSAIPVLPNTKDDSSIFELKDDESYGCTYIWDIKDTFTSGSSKSFGTCKSSQYKT